MNSIQKIFYAGGRFVNSVLAPFGYEVRPLVDDSDGFLLSEKYIAKQNQRILGEFLASIGSMRLGQGVAPRDVLRFIQEFRELYKAVPVKITHGGSGFNNCLNLHLVSKLLDPDIIIESGTYKGVSSWVLRNACPGAELHCFDLSFAHLKYRDPSIHYHQEEMTSVRLSFGRSKRVLAFFDDHVSQCKRLMDAKNLGVRYILFDDNYEVERLYVDKAPAVPTVAMITDDGIQDGEVIEWAGYRQRYSYKHELVSARVARDEIVEYVSLPPLGVVTGYRPSCIAYVELKQGGTGGYDRIQI